METNRSQLVSFICAHASRSYMSELLISAQTLSEEKAGEVLEKCRRLETEWASDKDLKRDNGTLSS